MSSHPEYRAEPTQIIEGQYLDQHKLMSLLKGVYGISDEGKNNFRVEVRCYFRYSAQFLRRLWQNHIHS